MLNLSREKDVLELNPFSFDHWHVPVHNFDIYLFGNILGILENVGTAKVTYMKVEQKCNLKDMKYKTCGFKG